MPSNFEFDLKRAAGKLIANASTDVPWPACGTKHRIKGEDIARERTFTCRGCRREVKIHDKDHGFERIIDGR